MDENNSLQNLLKQFSQTPPDQPTALLHLGDRLFTTDGAEGVRLSLACYKKALAAEPENPQIYLRLGRAYRKLDQEEESREAIRQALALEPDLIEAHLQMLTSFTPRFYPDEAAVQSNRAGYRQQLDHLAEVVGQATPDQRRLAATRIGPHTFNLPYQGYPDKDLQARYGQVLAQLSAARYPQWLEPRPVPVRQPGEPLRLGIVSAYFRRHAVWNFPTHGLLKALDRSKIRLYGYHVGLFEDELTAFARQSFDHFVEKIASVSEMAAHIAADDLDAILYPEIGMDGPTIRLAALRLAPLQCAFWGHSTTTGLPTMDFFIGSHLMEPPNAQAHYTEQLIRLPGLSVYYPAPPSRQPIPPNREKLGLRPSAVVYLCAQNPIKYLPQHDEVYAKIAGAVPDCQFVFLSGRFMPTQIQSLQTRIELAFERHGVQSAGRLLFLPALPAEDYLTLFHSADVFLDSTGWSGCNTTFDAVDASLPVVTLPLELMRSRQSMAILSVLELPETIAKNTEEYVSIAVQLGKDAEFHERVESKIKMNKHRLYNDERPIRAFENFLSQAAAEYASRRRDLAAI